MFLELPTDPHFKFSLDKDGCSPYAINSIWRAQNVCVNENWPMNKPEYVPSAPTEAVIKHNLKPKHWSVLRFGYAVIHYSGFPNYAVMQLVRHQDSAHLVQSQRYTGERLLKVNPKFNFNEIESLFYLRKSNKIVSRNGIKNIDTKEYGKFLADTARFIHFGVIEYQKYKKLKYPEDVIRPLISPAIRQNGVIAGSFQDLFHMLDQRTLADTSLECQAMAKGIFEQLFVLEPELMEFYRRTRYAKAILSP
jgi:thymidylate synthase (FAD)